MILKRIFHIAAAAMCITMVCAPAFASDTVSDTEAVDTASDTIYDYETPVLDMGCSLTISVKSNDEAVSGMSVEIRKVADYTEEGGSISYELPEEYSAYVDIVSFDGITASESEAIASILASVETQSLSSGTTDANGSVSFYISDYGVYLVTQGEDDSGYEMEAYLIQVPLYDEECGEWIYEVESIPKTEVKEVSTDTVVSIHDVKTGDTDIPYMLAGFLIAAAAILAAVIVKRKKGASSDGKPSAAEPESEEVVVKDVSVDKESDMPQHEQKDFFESSDDLEVYEFNEDGNLEWKFSFSGGEEGEDAAESEGSADDAEDAGESDEFRSDELDDLI